MIQAQERIPTEKGKIKPKSNPIEARLWSEVKLRLYFGAHACEEKNGHGRPVITASAKQTWN